MTLLTDNRARLPMANINHLNIAVKKDWPLANPWPWLSVGVALAIWSWAWTLIWKEHASDARIIVLAVGLLFTGIGLWLRWQANRQTVFLPDRPARLARLVMAGLFGAIALGVTALLVMTYVGWQQINFHPGATTLIWLTVAPATWYAARRCWKSHRRDLPVDAEEETGLTFVAVAAICLIGTMTLYLGDLQTDWDTIRMFLRVVVAVALLAAAVSLVSMRLRRLLLVFLFAVHFTGICTAGLSAPPSPWLVQQLWVRIYRPYLEFVYLTNAYHFYAPEPGPSSYLWFRIIYTTDNGQEVGRWEKIPRWTTRGVSAIQWRWSISGSWR